jgi:hypothetical protein
MRDKGSGSAAVSTGLSALFRPFIAIRSYGY